MADYIIFILYKKPIYYLCYKCHLLNLYIKKNNNNKKHILKDLEDLFIWQQEIKSQDPLLFQNNNNQLIIRIIIIIIIVLIK